MVRFDQGKGNRFRFNRVKLRLAIGVFALALMGCGEPTTSEDTAKTPAQAPSRVAQSTTTSSLPTPTTGPTTTPTTTPATTSASESPGRAPLTDLGVEPGVPIEQPAGFPVLATGEPLLLPPSGHPAALISSRVEVDSDALDVLQPYELTVIYEGDLWVVDYPGGDRLVGRDEVFLGRSGDGDWVEVEGFDWPPYGPYGDWALIQSLADSVLSDGFAVEDHERISEFETVHLRSSAAASDVWADVWVDAHGAVMRLVLDLGGDDPNRAWMVWEVLSLQPELDGPLPPD